METTFQKIIRRTGRKPIECKCNECKKQCKTVCLGTPEDIERLIDAGFGNKLEFTIWGVGKMLGKINYTIPMIQPIQTDSGCVFFQNGLCELHEKGLKPTEGRLSHHSVTLDNFSFRKSIAWNVAKEWVDEQNVEVIERIMDKIKVKTLACNEDKCFSDPT